MQFFQVNFSIEFLKRFFEFKCILIPEISIRYDHDINNSHLA